jgi:drug/metabolite transporter (DMT)-like permease
VAAQPLFVFFLSTILLRRIERVTVPIVIGGLATVVGVVLVAT